MNPSGINNYHSYGQTPAYASSDESPRVARERGEALLTGTSGLYANVEEGLKWLQKAADGGDHIAERKLALIYLDGEHGIQVDLSKGWSLLLEAARGDDAEAEYSVGWTLVWGKYGQSQNYERGGYWLMLASAQGHEKAKVHWAVLQYYGWGGVKKDMDAAVKVWRQHRHIEFAREILALHEKSVEQARQRQAQEELLATLRREQERLQGAIRANNSRIWELQANAMFSRLNGSPFKW